MNDKTLKKEFIDTALMKINKVINMILQYYEIDMTYDINERNKLFCEIIKQTKTQTSSPEMFGKIQKILHSNEILGTESSEWLSKQIYDYHKDIFLLHYFYASLYSYNYDVQIREKITEEHIKKFFLKANEIYKKYKDLKESATGKLDK